MAPVPESLADFFVDPEAPSPDPPSFDSPPLEAAPEAVSFESPPPDEPSPDEPSPDEPSPDEVDPDLERELLLVDDRSFFAQPEPLKWTAGVVIALRNVPSAPQFGQNLGPESLMPWITSVRCRQVAQT
ncbi:MAG TPA: hypothetical protein VIF63_06385 [Candidatus Limnocylindrales bacterium]